MTGITIDFIFYTNSSYFETSKSFISSVLHYMLIGEYFSFYCEWMFTSRFFGTHISSCEIMIEDALTKVNVILLEMCDVDMVLEMDWLFNHRVLMDCFTKKSVLSKLGYLELKFESNKRILSMCLISTLEVKRLLHKGCEA